MEDPADRLLRVVVVGHAPLVADQRVGIRIDHTRMHFFDERTGRRLQ
jgi:hypothetical protein